MMHIVSMKPKRFISWKWNSVESSIVSHLHNINQLNGFKLSTIDVKCRRIFIIHAFKIELPFAFGIEIRAKWFKRSQAVPVHFTKDKSFFAPFVHNAMRPKKSVHLNCRFDAIMVRAVSIDADLLIRKQVAVSVYLHMTHMYRISSMCKLFNRLRIVESNFILQWVIQCGKHRYTSRWPQNSNTVQRNKLPIAVGIHVNEVNLQQIDTCGANERTSNEWARERNSIKVLIMSSQFSAWQNRWTRDVRMHER